MFVITVVHIMMLQTVRMNGGCSAAYDTDYYKKSFEVILKSLHTPDFWLAFVAISAWSAVNDVMQQSLHNHYSPVHSCIM